MKLLLDTHLLLWIVGSPGRVPPAARILIEDRDNDLIFSSASLWEIAVKRSLGRPDFQADPRLLRRGLLDHGYEDLPITSDHTLHVLTLPPMHKDPFDRILIAQASLEGFVLLTSDKAVAQYPGPIRKV